MTSAAEALDGVLVEVRRLKALYLDLKVDPLPGTPETVVSHDEHDCEITKWAGVGALLAVESFVEHGREDLRAADLL